MVVSAAGTYSSQINHISCSLAPRKNRKTLNLILFLSGSYICNFIIIPITYDDISTQHVYFEVEDVATSQQQAAKVVKY